MYHTDANINIAVERQAERVRAVQAYGLPHGHSAPSWSIDDARSSQWPAAHMRLGLVMTILLIGMLLVVVASTGGIAGL